MKEINVSTKNFLDGLLKDDASYRFTPKSEFSNALSTCFAVLAYELLNIKLTTINNTVRYLSKFQQEDGLFIDDSMLGLSRGTHDVEYINHQVTYHILLVLDSYDLKPQSPLIFLDKFKCEKYLEEWLDGLNWKNPWLVSNNVMFLLNFFIFQGDNEQYIDYVMDWLDKKQDPINGMWNLGHKVTIHNQMAGAFHFAYFYDYLGREISCKDKIIENTMLIQDFDGLFSYDTGGGACDDLDAIDLLVRYRSFSENKAGLNNTIEKAKIALIKNQNMDGGFCWAKRTKFNFNIISNLIPLRLIMSGNYIDAKYSIIQKIKNLIATTIMKNKLDWRYSGVNAMRIRLDESDVFSTWFRLLSLNLISFYEGDQNVTFRTKAGIGYIRK